jgi:hypothetical protein
MAQAAAAHTRQAELEAELAELKPRYEAAERALENIKGSASWRLTEPLRFAKRRVGRLKG